MKYQLKGDYFFGQFHSTQGSSLIKKFCPGNTSDQLWEMAPDVSHNQKVIDSACEGFEKWRKTSLEDRITCLKKYQKIVQENEDQIAMALALEVGKPLWEAKTEAAALAKKVDVTLNESLKRVQNKTYPEIMPNLTGHLQYRPLGPCFIIGPFNFPCHLANGQILSALLMGNSIIFKPSEKTLYSAQLMFECLSQAGFPPGVVNFITGAGQTAQSIIADQRIRGVFFTGSKNVGLAIRKSTVEQLSKLVALELGGKNSSIVHKDAPLEHSLTELIKAAFLTTGQRCTSTGTILVHKEIAEEFTDKFIALTKKIHTDHPVDFERTPFMGPLIDEQAAQLFKEYVSNVEQQGGEALLPLKPIERQFPGHYYAPAIHRVINFQAQKHSFVLDEIFAPHCTIIPYNDLEEAIEIANSTEYGLAASIFTNNMSHYQTCLSEIEAGILNCNRSTVGASSKLPFGGFKSSGNFRPAAVAMIDSCAQPLAGLETQDSSSRYQDIPGLYEAL